MDSLIETFHIDWKLLLAQVANFAVVFLVLYFFALKPLAKTMKERSDKIAKGIQDGQDAQKKLTQIQEDYKTEILKAKKEAGEIVAHAGELAEEQKKQTIAKAKEEIAAVIDREKARIETQKFQVAKEIKAEVADLVVASMQKILGEKADVKLNKEILNKIIEGGK
jgi:F-type H+-transporting ATPase subunit b